MITWRDLVRLSPALAKYEAAARSCALHARSDGSKMAATLLRVPAVAAGARPAGSADTRRKGGTTVTTIRQLETAALDAHRRGDTWTAFWNRHGADVAAVASSGVMAHDQFVSHLLALVVSGDVAGTSQSMRVSAIRSITSYPRRPPLRR